MPPTSTRPSPHSTRRRRTLSPSNTTTRATTTTSSSSSAAAAAATTRLAYATLAPHTTHIPANKILKKWKPLPLPTQERIKTLLLLLKTDSGAMRRNANMKSAGRFGIGIGNGNGNGIRGARKTDLYDAESEAVVDDVVKRLVGRVGKMPFPNDASIVGGGGVGKGKGRGGGSSSGMMSISELDFDFEKTLERIAMLEMEVQMNVEGGRLLKEQIRREGRLLQRDKMELEVLTEGIRRERAEGARRERSLHVIARGLGREDGEAEEEGERVEERDDVNGDGSGDGWQLCGDMTGGISSSTTRTAKTTLTSQSISADPHLALLVKQLRSHLSSMQTNTSSLQPVRTALAAADSALTNFAWKSLPKEQYEKIVGMSRQTST